MKKFIIRPMVFLAICVLGKEKAFAQAPIWADNHDTSFQDGFLKQKQYNQRLYNQMTDSAQKAHHIKEYYRWTGFWQNRADYTRNPNGDMNTADLMAAGTLGNPICDASVNGRIWRYAGHIAGPQEKRYALTGKGVVYSVFVDTLGDPTFNTIYIGTGNGLWKTTNANDSIPAWYNMLEKERIAGVAVNDIEVVHYPNQDQPWIFIATGLIHGFGHSTSSYGVGVLKSEDGGKSWKKTALTYAAENKKLTWEIVRHPSNPNRFFALTQNEVLETKNRFQTVQLRYRHRFEKKYARDMVFHPTDTSRAYVTFDANQRGTSAYGQIFYFEVDNPDPDWRNHWHDITQRIGVNQNQGNVLRFDLAVSKAAPNHLYVSSQNKAYISRDNAQTFSPFRGNSFSVGASWWKNDFQVSPTDSATAYKGGIYISKTNNLKNWTDIQKPLHDDQRRILVLKGLDGKDWVYSCNDGDLGISYDGGNTWKRVSEHCTDSCLNITQIFGFDLDKNGQCMAYGCQDLGNYASNNTSQNWKKLNIGGDGYGVEYNLWGENFLLWANDYALLFKNCLNNREEIGYLTEDHKRNPQHEFINGQLYFLHHKRFWRSK
ncbi:MAG: hypothetical protein VXX63_03080, partial [Bacteroidota bacterium]|nr:hypothetical protein [Bacteroidota bacterium]